ncbi:MAG TPA: membrane protein insertase YidC, partial [Bacteroidales bacterium]|nr:membrane protein insertase YidC [Bacteroidales bacterium]HRX95801.1 membrane protein insertase YidC [Bacteroidales bacterium]
MDRNTIYGLILIFAILVGYSVWMTPSSEEIEAKARKQDSITKANNFQDSLAALERTKQIAIEKSRDSIQQSQATVNGGMVSQTNNVNRELLGVFANSGQGEDDLFTLENELMKITISARGGKVYKVDLKDYETYDSLPLIPFDPEQTHFGLNLFVQGKSINTDNLYFQPLVDETGFYVDGDNTRSFSMRLYTDASDSTYNQNSYIEFLYTMKGNDYMLDYDINFVGMDPYLERGMNYLDLNWGTEMLQLEKSVDRFNGPTIYYKFYQDDVDFLSEAKDDEEDLVNRIKWVSFKQRFFSSTLISKDFFQSAKIKTFTLENQHPHYLRSMETTIGLPFNVAPEVNIPMEFYFGPNKFKILKKYDLDLERQIPLGWSFFLMAWINRYAVLPVFNFLEGFGWNYGIIILVLTILLKIVLFPIAYKSYSSSAKMRVLKPEIEEISKKYPKKEDAMKKQQATMNLYKQAGVNPMAGCIPMLLQFPILIAMFRFFPSAIELRQQSFLWAHDLSSYDSILNLPFNIPFYGNHVSLFTLLMTISTLIYTKMNQDMMGSGQQQLPGMKTMMYLMPVMFLGIFNNYASGLSYYYFLANIITFGQMFLIRRTIDEKKIRKQIEINKKKPKKKSNWQKRLEDAAKQRGYNPSKK